MTNPEISVVSFNSAAPTQIFAGCGNVEVQVLTITSGQGVAVGTSSVAYGTAATTWLNLSAGGAFTAEFKADAALYAIASSGASGTLRVIRWF